MADDTIPRRDFLKGAVGAVGTAAAITTVGSEQAQAQPAPQSDSDKAPTILACFNAGQTEIRDLRACAQAWLTPQALLLCALQNSDAGKAAAIACPFLPDTPNGRAILDALARCHGKIYGSGGAAAALGLKPTTLYGKMRKHRIPKYPSTNE